jgi:hypothetical protein
MPDLPLKITEVRSARRHRAALASLTCVLLQGNTMRLRAALAKIQKHWRIQATKLYKAGWSPFATSEPVLALWYARNCPPPGVVVTGRVHFCNHTRVCPFCWARRVVLAGFSFVENLCYGPPAKNPPDPPAGVELVAFRTRRRFGASKPLSDKKWAAAMFAAFGAEGGARAEVFNMQVRRAEVKVLDPLAAFVTHRVTLSRDNQYAHVDRCGLALVREAVSPDAYREGLRDALGNLFPRRSRDVVYRAYGTPTKKALLAATRFALYYPRQMLFGPVERVAGLLEGLSAGKTLRLTARYGARSQKTLFNLLGLEVPGGHEDDA